MVKIIYSVIRAKYLSDDIKTCAGNKRNLETQRNTFMDDIQVAFDNIQFYVFESVARD